MKPGQKLDIKQMTFLLLPWVMCLLLFSSCSDTRNSHWEDGSLRSSISYRKGELHGPAMWYHRNGNKREEFHYISGVLNGPAVRWYYSGHRQSEDMYVNGRRTGLSRTWNEDGTLIKAEEFENDTLHGSFQTYHPNGVAMVVGSYYKGLYDGFWVYQNQAGQKVGEGRYTRGNGVLLAFDMQGKLIRKVHYEQNEKSGNELWFSSSGDTARILEYDAGRLIREEIRDPEVSGSW